MKKILSVLLIVSLLALCACTGGQGGESSAGSASASQSEASTTPQVSESSGASEAPETSASSDSSESSVTPESSESSEASEASETSESSESAESSEASDSSAASLPAPTETLSASGDGEHVILADGEEASYENLLIEKTGDSDGEDADFYGDNAAVFATNGANLTLSNLVVNTDGEHANGIFSYGEGTVVTVSDTVINTSSNTSGGIMITGGGTMYGENLTIVTQGRSSAALRSDRGGGTGVFTGGYYETNGKGSPAIYCTADITVEGGELLSNVSEGIVIEGKNSVTLNDCTVVANNVEKNSDKSDKYQAVKIYQSMSGDASVGTSLFTMTGGSMTSLNGGMFWVSNTSTEIYLENVAFTYASEDFLTAEGAGWGSEGRNGGAVTLTTKDQTIDGNITIDEISSLNFTMQSGTVFTGAINADNQGGDVALVLEEGAVWTLTADSYVDSLENAGAINLNGFSLYVGGALWGEG